MSDLWLATSRTCGTKIMRKIIHNLRQQPEKERRHILHIVTFVCAVVLIILWIWSLGKNISSPETKIKAKQDIQPFSALKSNVVDGFYSITGKDNK